MNNSNNNNNNKRSLDFVDNSSNKKERLKDNNTSSSSSSNNNNNSNSNNNNNKYNNNNNSNSNNKSSEYEIFISKEYKDTRVNELREYALNIGIDSRGNKQVLYERIKQQLKDKEQLEKEKQQRDSINSFNKGAIQLLVKDISHLERSFWSVFRNKSIYKQIFSNFKFSKSFSYDKLFNTKYILYSYTNGKEILVDKVKSDDYLEFSDCYVFGNGTPFGIGLLCSTFNKDTTENKEFIQRLISPSYKYSKSIHPMLLVKEAIQHSNIMVLKALNTTKQDIEMILSRDSIRINISSYSNIKMIKYLTNSLGYEIEKVKYDTSKNGSRSFSGSGNSSGNGGDSCSGSFKIGLYNLNIFEESFKFKHLIKLVEILPLIYILDQQQINIIESLKSTSLSTTFTPQQLKSSINQLLNQYSAIVVNNNNNDSNNNNINNSSNNQIKSIILKYIDIYYSVCINNENDLPLDYYMLFKDIESIKNKISTIFNSHYDNSNLGRILIKPFSCLLKLAKSCKNQINYDVFNYLIQFLKDNDMSNVYLFKELLVLVLESGDFGLIQLLFNQLSIQKINDIISSYTIHPVIEGIESTQVLDYLYQHYPSLHLFRDGNSYCFYVRDITILKRYEELMARSGSHFIIDRIYEKFNRKPKSKVIDLVPPIVVLDRAIDNPNIYQYRSYTKKPIESSPGYLEFLISDQGSAYYNQLAIKLFKSHTLNKSRIIPSDEACCINPLVNKEFLNWLNDSMVQVSSDQQNLFELTLNINYSNSGSGSNDSSGSTTEQNNNNNNNKLESRSNGTINVIVTSAILFNLLYTVGKYDQLFNLCSDQNGYPFSLSIEFIDQFINFELLKLSPSSYLHWFIRAIISSNNLTAMNLIKLKYNQLLLMKSKSNQDGVLDSKTLKELLVLSIEPDNYYTTSFLLNYIHISKKEYNKIYDNIIKPIFSVVDDNLSNRLK